MNKKVSSFIIYDYETFGINTALDRPAQFACIHTDENFIQISEPKIYYCKFSNDYIPKIESVIINGITPQKVLYSGLIESEFSIKIYKLFNISNTCIIGFNNINFDDEFTRNLFYRNFYNSYYWNCSNGNARLDVINIVYACYILRPNGINWPINNRGVTSFKLKDLSIFNDIKHNNAHDALSDVYATLSLIKFIRNIKPNLFNYFYNYRFKYKLKSLINFNKPLIYISSVFGIKNNNIGIILPIIWHPYNKNILIVCNLIDKVEILKHLDINILKKKFYNNNCLLNNKIINPLYFLHINKFPIITPLKFLRNKDILRLNIDINLCFKNLNWLMNYKNLKNKILNIFSKKFLFKYGNNVDSQLYKNFFNKNDNFFIKKISKLSPKKLILSNFNFKDSRLKFLFFRYYSRNFPFILNNYQQLFWLKYCKKFSTKLFYEFYIINLKFLYILYINNNYKKYLLRSLFNYVNFLFFKLYYEDKGKIIDLLS